MGLRFADGRRTGDAPVSSFRPSSPAFLIREGLWLQPLARYHFEVVVEHSSSGGIVPTPARAGIWRIGFVLNVAYERVSVRYGSDRPISATWRRPVLDSASPTSRPFVHDPAEQVIRIPIFIDGEATERFVEDRVNVVPGKELFYGPLGLGELVDPFGAVGYVPWSAQRLPLIYEDRPYLAVPQTLGGRRLARLEQLVVFRFWIIAQDTGRRRTNVLATSPEFTMAAWLETGPSALLSLEPRPAWMCYGLAGRWLRLFQNHGEREAAEQRTSELRPQPGRAGGPWPVLEGATANERLSEWVHRQGLGRGDLDVPAVTR